MARLDQLSFYLASWRKIMVSVLDRKIGSSRISTIYSRCQSFCAATLRGNGVLFITTVHGKNSAPVDMVNIPLFTGFH